MRADVIGDSGFLFEFFNHDAPRHAVVVAAVEQIRGTLIVPSVVLTETAYLFRRFGGVRAVSQFIANFIAARLEIENIRHVDLLRARQIMDSYPDARLDFVDCCIVAVAERLDIVRVATVDRRDFDIIRPRHVENFRLIP